MEMALPMRSNRTYGTELVMPMNAIALDNDEMEYVDGGGVPTWIVGAGIDVGVTLLTGGAGLTYSAVGYLIGRGATSLVQFAAKRFGVQIATRLAQCLGIVGTSYAGGKLGALGIALGATSIGGLLSTIMDSADGSLNGWIG